MSLAATVNQIAKIFVIGDDDKLFVDGFMQYLYILRLRHYF